MKAWVAVAILFTGCDRRAHVHSCADDLGGLWITTSGARWMALDLDGSLEIYPMFDDAVPSPGAARELVIAPRVIDVHRAGAGLAGDVKQRFMQRADTCEAHAPVLVTACKDDALEVAMADVAAPQTFAPCTWPPRWPARVESWRHE